MNATILLNKFDSDWDAMTPAQKNAFRATVTRTLKQTPAGAEHLELVCLYERINPGKTAPEAATSASGGFMLMPPIYKLSMVRERGAREITVRSPEEVARMLTQLIGDEPQEHFVVVMLDTKNKVIGINTVYIGTLDGINIRIAEIFRPAILANAQSIIIAHNHPSGEPTPSPEDVRTTTKVVAAGELLQITVLDHLVIGDGCYVSLKERGLGF